MPDAASIRRVALLSLALLVVRIASALLVSQPGYTDSYYFTGVAERLAAGQGLSADFIWSPLEAKRTSWALPVPSHLFWVPLPTVVAAAGVAALGPLLGTFRAAQLPLVALAALLPLVTYLASRRLGAAERMSLVAAAIAGLGGLFAPGFVAVDAFALAALLGTAFFLVYGHAAAGSVRAGVAAGVLVGLLYLARSEGALFGLVLLGLLRVPSARRAAVAGTVAALAIGLVWVMREMSLSAGTSVLARSALLTRYEDFFAIQPDYLGGSLADLLVPKLGALATNALTFVFSFALLLVVPLGTGLRAMRERPDVRAWLALAVLIYAAQSLVWTLHSTRGSYFHSLAAFFPFGVAIAAVGAERLLASRGRAAADAWTLGAGVLVVALSVAAVAQWDAVFNGGSRVRAAAVEAIPDGPFLAIDAAAWRWIADRPVVVTPADGLEEAGCVARLVGARSVVLEAAHFSRYDALYRGESRPTWLDEPIVRGAIRIYPVRWVPECGHG